jgi:hypothetical protein
MLPHAYLIELFTGGIAWGTLGLSGWNLWQAVLDYRAELVERTSSTALKRTRGDLRVECVQLAQVVMLVWFSSRRVLVAPPEQAAEWLSPVQVSQLNLVFITFVLLKALGRYFERRTRLEVRDEYRREFVSTGRASRWQLERNEREGD